MRQPSGRPQPGRGAPSPREIASYLVALRPVLAHATEARRTWVRRIGVLMEDARRGNPSIVAQSAGNIGREYVGAFKASRARLDTLRPPRGCDECHSSLGLWLEKLVAACEVLLDVGQTGSVARIRDTQGLLAEGRAHAHRFNNEYARLVADLRERVATTRAGPRPTPPPRPRG